MYQLFPPLMAAAVIGLYSMGPVPGASMDVEQVTSDRIVAGITVIDHAWQQFLKEHSVSEWQCELTEERETCQRVSRPAFIPTADMWLNDLLPKYAFVPRPPPGMEWDYAIKQSGKPFFCFTGNSLSETQMKGLKRAKKRLALAEVVFSDYCGASGGLEISLHDAGEINSVTYWPPSERTMSASSSGLGNGNSDGTGSGKDIKDCAPGRDAECRPPGWKDDFTPPGHLNH